MNSSIPSTNVLVWLSIKPVIRLAIPIAAGFMLAKTKVLPPIATRVFSTLILNLTLPALLFSKIVPSFNSSNISSLGPLCLTAFLYQGVSAGLGVVARAITPTPRRFRYGLIAAMAFSNWGDLPTAVLQSVTQSSPFNGSEDEQLAIAFISIFILVNFMSMFPFQGLYCVKMDYCTPPRIDPLEELRYESGALGTRKKWIMRLRRGRPMQWEMDEAAGSTQANQNEDTLEKNDFAECAAVPAVMSADQAEVDLSRSVHDTDFPVLNPVPSAHSSKSTSSSPHPSATVRALQSVGSFLRSIATPPTVTLLLSMVIALVPVLKALFVSSDGEPIHPTAPDGDPPLSVLYNTAQFIGGASVPLGLVVLGASMAKMQIPRPIVRLPLQSIAAMAGVKLVLLPIIGFFWTKMLVQHTGMVGRDDHVLRITLIYMSCVPTGTIQIAFSQLYGTPEANNSELLSSYILAQYLCFVVSSVLLTALSLESNF